MTLMLTNMADTFEVQYWSEETGEFMIKKKELPIKFEKVFVKEFHEPKKGCVAITIPSEQQLTEWIEKQEK